MRKKTQYIVVNEIYKTIYCGYPQKRAWKNLTTAEGGAQEGHLHNQCDRIAEFHLSKAEPPEKRISKRYSPFKSALSGDF